MSVKLSEAMRWYVGDVQARERALDAARRAVDAGRGVYKPRYAQKKGLNDNTGCYGDDHSLPLGPGYMGDGNRRILPC